MNKRFRYYNICWAILLGVYNVIVFTVQPMFWFVKLFDARFWISWGVTIAAYIGQLICALVAFRDEHAEKRFLNIPLITQSYTGAILTMVIGSICLLIPNCPAWIAAIACACVLAISAIGVLKAKAAEELVDDVGERVKAKTFFIKSLAVDVETLMARATDDDIQAELKKVYEAIRYSDPMSHEALASIEGQITLAFAQLSAAVAENNAKAVQTEASALLLLVKERNAKCRESKFPSRDIEE